MNFKSLTRGKEIGANSYVLEINGSKILLDAGMHPKKEGNDSIPRYELLEKDSLDAIIVTHAHLDHLGTLPVVARQHPSAEIFMSFETRFVAEAMLHNSVNVMTSKREELGMVEYPFFNHREIDDLVARWRTPALNRVFTIGDDDLTAEFFPAGHILGAVGVKFQSLDGGSVFYTGDVKFEAQEIVKGASFPEEEIDTLIVETTRGAVSRDPEWSREGEIDRLVKVINDTWERKGSVMMPIFALGRTQEFLVIVDRLKREGRIPDIPLYIGGLSTKITKIFDDISDSSWRNLKGYKILEEVDLHIASRKRGTQLKYEPRCLYLITSGMMSEHTLSHQFTPKMIQNERDAIVFTGYSDPDTPAGYLRASKKGEKFSFGEKGPELNFSAEVIELQLSGHAEREQIMEYIKKVNPKNVVLVHGDLEASIWFRNQIGVDLPDAMVEIPEPGKDIAL